MILPIPLRLVHENNRNGNRNNHINNHPINNNISNHNHTIISSSSNKKVDNANDDFHITATNLLGDIALLDSNQVQPSLVAKYITPEIVSLCKHPSFQVRRAAVQSLPRIIYGSSIGDVEQNLLPCFVRLGMDEMYRVRKSVGECLVDMSRSLMLVPFTSNATKKTNQTTKAGIGGASIEMLNLTL